MKIRLCIRYDFLMALLIFRSCDTLEVLRMCSKVKDLEEREKLSSVQVEKTGHQLICVVL